MPKVLVIDDEAELTVIIGQFLRNAGFSVETATSGQEGLDKAISMQPDVAIVDIMMPEMDGYEVCRRLRQDPRTARTLIAVLTARGQAIDKQVAFRAGADAHVTKPFQGRALAQEVQDLLDGRPPPVLPLGFQILVLRLKEKAGATTLATNLALCLSKEEGQLAIATDVVVEDGQIEKRLGLPLAKSWPESFEEDADGLVRCLLRHKSGLFVLPSPPPSAGELGAETVERTLQALQGWFDYVVVDTPYNLKSLAPVLFMSSHLILLVLTPDSAALRKAQASLAAIREYGSRSLQIWPILSMMKADSRFLPQKVAEVLGLPVAALIPWAPQEYAQAVADGRPVVLSHPDSPLARAFQELARQAVQARAASPLRSIPT
jgi:CheY-like chemotaxis protein